MSSRSQPDRNLLPLRAPAGAIDGLEITGYRETPFFSTHEDRLCQWLEIEVIYSRSSGPGGQHVNKTESRVTLRFALADSPSIPDRERWWMLKRLESRLTTSGELLVSCEKHRDRSRNLSDAFARLRDLLVAALYRPPRRRKTRPTRGSVERRLRDKRRHSVRKQERRRPSDCIGAMTMRGPGCAT